MFNSTETLIAEYRGILIYRINHSGWYVARTVNGTVRADTLAGIKSLIRGTNES